MLKPPSLLLRSALIVGALAFFGCGDDPYSCTTDLRSAVLVRVSSDEGIEPDRVTARRRVENECDLVGGSYACYEQGGGKYVVRVYSGSQTWTRSVEVEADRCHVDYPPEHLAIELATSTAD